MKVLGIDPGSLFCGYGLVEAVGPKTRPQHTRRSACDYRKSGRIALPPSNLLHERLRELFGSLREVIEECGPDEIVIERMFFAKGIKSALSLGHTRGVVLLAASMSGASLHEYSALEVKQAVAGYGRADKQQVQRMVQQILGIRHALSPDGADALALALCHINMQSSVAAFEAAGKKTLRTARR